MNYHSRRSSRGFSILELLVVISIIMLLMATLFFAVGKIRDKVRRDQTKNVIQKVYAALDSYKLVFRAYPPANTPSPGSVSNGKALYYWLQSTFRVNTATTPGSKVSTVNYDPVLNLDKRDYIDGPSPELIDAWASPLIFKVENDTANTINEGLNTMIVYTRKPIIYSCGPNKIDDGGPSGTNTDDIILGQ